MPDYVILQTRQLKFTATADDDNAALAMVAAGTATLVSSETTAGSVKLAPPAKSAAQMVPQTHVAGKVAALAALRAQAASSPTPLPSASEPVATNVAPATA